MTWDDIVKAYEACQNGDKSLYHKISLQAHSDAGAVESDHELLKKLNSWVDLLKRQQKNS